MDWYSQEEHKEYECTECGTEIDKPGVCSGACHEASMIQLVKLVLSKRYIVNGEPFFIIFTLV